MMYRIALPLAVITLVSCGGPATPTNVEFDTPNTVQQGSTPGVSYGALEGVGGNSVNGIVVVHHTSESTGTVTFQANIEPAASGSHYVAWIENEKTNEELNIGMLESPTNDVRHALRYEAGQSLKGYNRAFITLRKNNNASQGDIVAEGKMDLSGQ